MSLQIFKQVVLTTFFLSILLVHPSLAREVCLSPECVAAAGSILMKTGPYPRGSPCEDLSEYACSMYQAPGRLPPGIPWKYPVGDNAEMGKMHLKFLLDQPFCSCPEVRTSAEDKARNFYQSCMNRTQDSMEELKDYVRQQGSWPMDPDWAPEMFDLEREAVAGMVSGLHSLLKISTKEDKYNTSLYRIAIPNHEILLNNVDYYTGASYEMNRQKYMEDFISISTTLGYGNNTELGRRLAGELWQLETNLSEIYATKQGFHGDFNLFMLGDLDRDSQGGPLEGSGKDRTGIRLNFTELMGRFYEEEVPQTETIMIWMPNFAKRLNDVLASTRLEALATYMMFSRIKALLPIVSMKYETGGERDWKTCLALVNKKMEMATASMYAKMFLFPGDREAIEELTRDILDYLQDRFDQIMWLDSDTRMKAKEKAANMLLKIAYPDFALDPAKVDEYYGSVRTSQSFLNNTLELAKWKHEEYLKDYMQKYNDKSKWYERPVGGVVFSRPDSNDLVISADLLQPSVYHHSYPKSMIYGGIGYIISHQILQAFVGESRNYDKNSNHVEWWSHNSTEQFEQRAQCFVAQYNKVQVDNLAVDGTQTLARNIGDNGGLSLAYGAYVRWLERNTDTLDVLDPLLPGLNVTNHQLFFIAASQLWCETQTREHLMMMIEKDEYAPGKARINVPPSNMPEFSEAFGCFPGRPMNPIKKCKVW